MTTVNIYLTFNGNCEEAFTFYKSIIGGEFTYIGKFRDMPEGEGKPTDPSDLDKILHVGLPISSETMLMGSDTTTDWSGDFKAGNNFSISMTTDSKERADELYNGLVEGGVSIMPMNQTFWGEYFGMLTDKFGIQWMVSLKDD